MNISDLTSVGKNLITLLADYHNAPHREMLMDPALFGYLRGRFGEIERQHYVYLYGSEKPQRIDFRYGTTNPVVFEFAVRPATSGGQLSGSQNASELRKLCRVKRNQARLRALLLVDFHHHAQDKEALKATYDPIHAGRGRFERNPVRVVYVHRDAEFNFLWKPFQQSLRAAAQPFAAGRRPCRAAP